MDTNPHDMRRQIGQATLTAGEKATSECVRFADMVAAWPDRPDGILQKAELLSRQAARLKNQVAKEMLTMRQAETQARQAVRP